jgi:WD40 repeat protein
VFSFRLSRRLVARSSNAVLAFDPDSPSEVVRFDRRILSSSYPETISPDGRWVTTIPSSRRRIQVWNGHTGALKTNLPTPGAGQGALSPDGHWLACSQGDSTTVWSTTDWSLRRRIRHPSVTGHQPLAFSPDGRLLAIAVAHSGIKLVRFETGEELATLPARRLMTSLRFSPAGDRLVVTHEPGHLRLRDLRRVRAHLACMKLDWEMPPAPPAAPARPLRVTVHTNASAN